MRLRRAAAAALIVHARSTPWWPYSSVGTCQARPPDRRLVWLQTAVAARVSILGGAALYFTRMRVSVRPRLSVQNAVYGLLQRLFAR